MAHQRVSQLGQHPSLNFTPAWPTKGWVKLEGPLPCLNFPLHCPHKKVGQVGKGTSFSKFYPCIAHKRVSQVGVTTTFSKFYPCIAHINGWVQFGESTWNGNILLNFTLALPTKGWVKLEWPLLYLNFTPALPTERGQSSWNGNILL